MITNYDGIKNMSLDDMAIFLVKCMDFVVRNTVGDLVDFKSIEKMHDDEIVESIQHLKQWLESEVAE